MERNDHVRRAVLEALAATRRNDSVDDIPQAAATLMEDTNRICAELRQNQNHQRVDFQFNIGLSPFTIRPIVLAYVNALRENKTVKTIIICIVEEASMDPEMAHALGNLFVHNKTIDTLFVANLSDEHSYLDNMWPGVLQSSSLNRLVAEGITWKQGGVARLVDVCFQKAAIHNNDDDDFRAFDSLMLQKCTFGRHDTDAVVRLLESPTKIVKELRLDKNCAYEQEALNKPRIARALGNSTTLVEFLLEDYLDHPYAKAFGKAIASNRHLETIHIHGCCDEALPFITQGIVNNVTLRRACINGQQEQVGELLEQYRSIAYHAVKLNRAGRRFFRNDFLPRPGNASLEEFWVSTIVSNRDDHKLIYSLIRGYPDLFTRCADL